MIDLAARARLQRRFLALYAINMALALAAVTIHGLWGLA